MLVTLIPGITTGLKRTDASKTSMSLGVLALAASAEKEGHIVNIQNIDYYIDKYKWKTDHTMYKKAADELIKTNAKVYGFYVAVGTLHHAVNISSEIKKSNRNAVITFGGPHATAVKEQILQHFPWVDYITSGEGDSTFVDFINYIDGKLDLSELKNLTYRLPNGDVVNSPDSAMIQNLDDLPVPAYYKHKSERDILDIIPIDVGRGCPYNCTFCSTSVFWKKRYRVKSVDRIISEMKYVKQLFNAKKVFLMHDCLTADQKMLFEICDAVSAADIGLEWGCAARLDHINEEVLEKLKKAHCTHLEIGIESGSELVRASVNKKLDSGKEAILEKLKLIHDCGISLVLFYICGFPTETSEDIEATLNMIRDTLDVMEGNGFFRLTYLELFAGTDMYKSEKEKAVFSTNIIDYENIKLYTDDEIVLARETDLFPEFYYVANDNLSPHYFRELSSVCSSFIKVIGTEFYLSYSVLLNIFNNDIHTFFQTWLKFEHSKKSRYRESGIIIANLLEYISYVSGKYNIPSYLLDLVKYEKAIYETRQEYLKNIKSVENGCISLVNCSVATIGSDIVSFINKIKDKDFNSVSVNEKKCYYVVSMQTSEKIKILKVSDAVFGILELCSGKYDKQALISEYYKKFDISDDNKPQTCEAIESVLSYFADKGLLRGI
jgi:radical SAM superfamily enzyme YgiQ (UPF0313 family)